MKTKAHSFLKNYITAAVLAALLLFTPFFLHAQDDEQRPRARKKKLNFDKELEKTEQLLVMLSVEYNGDPEFGSGIIFGRQKDKLLIATAYHILQRDGQKPQKIRVKFRCKTDTYIEATMLNYNNKNDMDLAVLSVDNLSKQGIDICLLPFNRLEWISDLKRGDEVFPVGNPNGAAWAMPIIPDKISEINSDQIVFQSAFISSGHSGGGLIDKNARLIGMMTADQPPFGRAINLNVVLTQVKQWGYPVQLDTTLPKGLTPLHIAAEKGDLNAVQRLLADCGNVNELDNHKAIALHFAA